MGLVHAATLSPSKRELVEAMRSHGMVVRALPLAEWRRLAVRREDPAIAAAVLALCRSPGAPLDEPDGPPDRLVVPSAGTSVIAWTTSIRCWPPLAGVK